MKKDYTELANKLLELVGGPENISRCMHCYTRLRFNLKDKGLANIEEIKKLDVVGAQYSGEQLQVIIGNDVTEVYDAVCKAGNLNTEEQIDELIEHDKVAEKKTFKSVLSKIVDGIVGCMIPMLPILIGAGLLKAIILVLINCGVQPDNATLVTLGNVADAGFYFMPVFIGAFAAKKFNVDLGLGMLVGAMLIHPNFVALVENGTPGSIFGLPIYAASYANSVVPVILSVWVMSFVEKFFREHTPKSMRSVLEPLLTLLVMIPLTFCCLAPLGAMMSNGFASMLNWLYETTGFVAVAIFAAIVPFVVMFGMHIGTVPIAMASIAATGVDRIILPGFFISNFTQGAACLAVGVKTKDEKLKSFAFASAFSNIVPGISEPGMYGITLRYKTPMWGAMIGALVGGIYFGIMKVGAMAFMPPNMFQFTAYIDQGNNLLHAAIGIVIAFAVAFVATMVLYKPERDERKGA